MSSLAGSTGQTHVFSKGASSSVGARRAIGWARIGSLFALFATLKFFLWMNPFRIGWDAASYVQAGDEILRGKVPFVDIVDVNPPLVQFLHVPAAWFARVTGLPAPLSFNLYVLAAAILSACAVNWLLKRPELRISDERRFAVLFTFAFANHVAWIGAHFGQREHFIVLSLLPFLLVRWLRHEGHRLPNALAVSIGFAAFTALAIKPHYLWPVLLFEAMFLLRHRTLRRLMGVELYGALGVAALYAGLFLAYPGMRREFLGRYLALFATGYRVYDCSFRELLLPTELWIAVSCAIFVLVRPGSRDGSRFARPLGVFLVGAITVYLAQHRGWLYQIFPAFALGSVAVAMVLPLSRFVPLLAAVGALGASVAWNVRNFAMPLPEERDIAGLRRAVQVMTRPGESVLIVSTSVLGPYPMQLQLGVRSGSRFAWNPFLGMFYPDGPKHSCTYRKWGEGLPAERQVLEDLAADIRARKPVLIAAQNQSQQAIRPGCTPSEWLQKSGLFERAMGDYTPLPQAAGFDVWGLKSRPLPEARPGATGPKPNP